jgi:hypothetical protein
MARTSTLEEPSLTSETADLQTKASHEAGHALVCHVLGRPYEFVTIVPDGVRPAGTKLVEDDREDQFVREAFDDVRSGQAIREEARGWIDREIMMLYAGALSVLIANGQGIDEPVEGCCEDLSRAFTLATRVYGECGERDDYWRQMRQRTWDWLHEHRAAKKLLTEQLLAQETLTADDVAELFGPDPDRHGSQQV